MKIYVTYREVVANFDKRLTEEFEIKERFVKLLRASSSALRSYQYGNSSSELAEEIADAIDIAVANERN
jgi:hypothetical protein